MPFYFLHPIYLYGLLAASLPLIIHLLNRRRLRRIRFPTVKFILLSQRRVSRSYNLRHWLLLALRTLSVLLLVLLLANPIFQSGVGLWAGGEPLSLVVVLDNSLSMKWNGGGQSFERAKEAARVLVSSFKKGDQGALIPTYLPADREILLTPRKELLRRELEATRITATTADFTQALNHAYELLSGPTRQKAIWLITDMGLTGWDRFDLSSLKQYDPLIPLKVLHVGGKPEPFNATVKEVRIRGQGVARDLPLEVGATIVNFGNQEIQDVLVQLRLDEQNRDQQIIALPPHGEAEVIFQLRLDRAGSHTGEVVMEKAGIAGNSTLSFVLHAQEKIRILVVDGDSKTSLAQSESFFLIRALHPGGEGRPSLFLPTVIPPEAMSSTSLSSYQAIILCNVPVIPQDVASGMAEYVRGGRRSPTIPRGPRAEGRLQPEALRFSPGPPSRKDRRSAIDPSGPGRDSGRDQQRAPGAERLRRLYRGVSEHGTGPRLFSRRQPVGNDPTGTGQRRPLVAGEKNRTREGFPLQYHRRQ